MIWELWEIEIYFDWVVQNISVKIFNIPIHPHTHIQILTQAHTNTNK